MASRDTALLDELLLALLDASLPLPLLTGPAEKFPHWRIPLGIIKNPPKFEGMKSSPDTLALVYACLYSFSHFSSPEFRLDVFLSQERIAYMSGLGRRTVQRAIDDLAQPSVRLLKIKMKRHGLKKHNYYTLEINSEWQVTKANTPRYCKIPQVLAARRDINPTAKKLFALICNDRNSQSFLTPARTLSEWARASGCTVDAFRYAKRQLIHAKVIYQFKGSGGLIRFAALQHPLVMDAAPEYIPKLALIKMPVAEMAKLVHSAQATQP